jgi:hypothetical protein
VIRLLLIAWSLLFFVVPAARADQTSVALRQLCGPRGDAIADLVRENSRRFLLHPVILASVIAAESPGCIDHGVGAHREVCLGQVIPGGAAATSPLLGRKFSRRELLQLDVCIYVTARYLSWNERTCPKGPEFWLTGYNQRHGCKRSHYARRVLGLLKMAQRGRDS